MRESDTRTTQFTSLAPTQPTSRLPLSPFVVLMRTHSDGPPFLPRAGSRVGAGEVGAACPIRHAGASPTGDLRWSKHEEELDDLAYLRFGSVYQGHGDFVPAITLPAGAGPWRRRPHTIIGDFPAPTYPRFARVCQALRAMTRTDGLMSDLSTHRKKATTGEVRIQPVTSRLIAGSTTRMTKANERRHDERTDQETEDVGQGIESRWLPH